MFFQTPTARPALPTPQATALQTLGPRRARIVLEPFRRGEAETLGTTLQRALLPMPGAYQPPRHREHAAPPEASPAPVRRLDFAVQPAGSVARNDLERLVVDIETDGSIQPVQALSQGAALLLSMMGSMVSIEEEPGGPPPPRPDPLPRDPILDQPIDDLDVSVRTANGLRALGIRVVGDLIRYSGADLLRAPYLGRRSLREVEDAVRSRGLMLADSFKEG